MSFFKEKGKDKPAAPPSRSAVDDLHIEDGGFLRTRVTRGAIAHLRETLLRAIDRLVKAFELDRNRIVRDDARRDVGHLPAQEVHGPDDDAGGGGNSGEGAVHRLPFGDFRPTWRGRPVPGAPLLEPARVCSFGLLVGDRQVGPFHLEISAIRAYRRRG